jgi:GDP-L-fucose synthase
VTDLARGCLLALEKHACAEPINIGSGQTVTVAEVARLVLEAADYPRADLRFNPEKPVTVRSRAVDCTRARQILGFAPTVGLSDGLRDTVAWYRAQSFKTEKEKA